MSTNMRIELVLKLNRMGQVPDWYRELFDGCVVMETEDRLTVDVPSDWSGFKDGTIIRILEAFQEAVYIALAYVSENSSEVVTDLEGKSVDRFDEVFEGRMCAKYVKKRLRVVRVIDEESEVFEVKGYVLNLQYPEPVVKVLDMYSVGSKGGLSLSQFVESRR